MDRALDEGSSTAERPPGLAARLLLNWIERSLRVGSLTITWPNGAVSQVRSGNDGPAAHVIMKRWRLIRRLLTGGSLAMSQAYLDDDWDSPDLATAVELAALHRDPGASGSGFSFGAAAELVDRIRHRRNANTRPGSRRNIAFHYDLGNAFYEQWLDKSLSYSSAIFGDRKQPLSDAQNNKCARLLDLLNAKPGEHLAAAGGIWRPRLPRSAAFA